MKKEKYYLKSLLRTIKKQPLQPVLIFFILVLSFIVSNLSFSVSNVFKENQDNSRMSMYGTSEIAITNNSSSSSRFILKEDVEDVLENATITGSFNVPFTNDQSLLYGMAVDFETVNEIFSFNFIEYSSFNINDRENIVFLYEDYANDNNINLNDSINLSLFGINKEFKVKGISSTPFFEDCYALCDIKAVIDALSNSSTYVSTFAGNLNLYGTVYIKTNGVNLDETIKLLENKFPDKTIEKVTLNLVTEQNISTAISIVMALLCFIITFTVLLTSTYCITKQRKELCDLFNLVGYTKKKIMFYRCIEMGFYCIIAGIVGTYLSTLVSTACYRLINLEYVSYKFSLTNALISFAILLICSMVPPLFTSSKIKTIKQDKKYSKYIILFPILTIILVITVLLINGLHKFKISIVALIVLFLTIAILTKPIIDYISNILVKKSKNVHHTIAYKNIKKIGEIANITKLVSIFGSVVISGFVMLMACISMTLCASYYVNGDYAIYGLGSNIEEKIESIEEVDSVTGFYMSSNQFTYNGKDVIIWATEDINAIGDASKFDTLPVGNELYSSIAYAGKYGLEVNDTVSLTYNGISKDYIVKKLYFSSDACFLIDINYANEKYNYYIVNGKENVSKVDLYSKLSTTLATKMATIVPTSDILKIIVDRQYSYIYFCIIILTIIVIFGTIGIFNNIYEAKKARKVEYEYYSICGMSKKDIKKMTRKEDSFTTIFAIIYALINSVISVIIFNEAVITYGACILPLLENYIKYILFKGA